MSAVAGQMPPELAERLGRTIGARPAVVREPSPAEQYAARERGAAETLAVIVGEHLNRDPLALYELANAIVRAAWLVGVPVTALAALTLAESRWENETEGSQVGPQQQTVRYAHEWWPYPLADDIDTRRGQMIGDVWAAAHAAALQLRKLWRDGERYRRAPERTTYREHAARDADTWAVKGVPLSTVPDSPVTANSRNPVFAMYNRGSRGGRYPYWARPNRGDGSAYQLNVERKAAAIGQRWRELGGALSPGPLLRRDTFSWRRG